MSKSMKVTSSKGTSTNGIMLMLTDEYLKTKKTTSESRIICNRTNIFSRIPHFLRRPNFSE